VQPQLLEAHDLVHSAHGLPQDQDFSEEQPGAEENDAYTEGVGNLEEDGVEIEDWVRGVGNELEQDWLLKGRHAAQLHGLADNSRLEHYWPLNAEMGGPDAHCLADTTHGLPQVQEFAEEEDGAQKNAEVRVGNKLEEEGTEIGAEAEVPGNELDDGAGIENGDVPGVGGQDWLLDAKVGGYAARLYGLADNPRLEHYYAHSLDDTSPFEQEWLLIHREQEMEGPDGRRR